MKIRVITTCPTCKDKTPADITKPAYFRQTLHRVTCGGCEKDTLFSFQKVSGAKKVLHEIVEHDGAENEKI